MFHRRNQESSQQWRPLRNDHGIRNCRFLQRSSTVRSGRCQPHQLRSFLCPGSQEGLSSQGHPGQCPRATEEWWTCQRIGTIEAKVVEIGVQPWIVDRPRIPVTAVDDSHRVSRQFDRKCLNDVRTRGE